MLTTFATVMGALPYLVKGMDAVPEIAKLVGDLVEGFRDRPEEQAAIQEALEDLAADNDEGHRRYQEKLAAAIARG